MKTQIFDPFDSVSTISFLLVLKCAHGTNGVHKGAAVGPAIIRETHLSRSA